MPWSGFFRKMAMSDVMVMFDDVQFERKEYTNRVKIRTNKGEEWLTVPVKHQPRETLIKDILIDNSKDWKKDHLNKIKEHYVKAPSFLKVYNSIQNIYKETHHYLWELNMDLIVLFKEILKIPADLHLSSDLGIKSKGSDKVLDICRMMNADIYLTGTSWAKDNLKLDDFANNDVDIIFLDSFKSHKPYTQCYEPFIPYLSELDYIMCGDY